ncbi:hypothetical protein GPECTOR_14g183 [Gonium pectorale]|uniref:THIF-type NAD/FAD binding fold domain-containing protein n=1 Tax=Gonium pectorale TaxID=33097 RepID=A0A150GMD7_GONPE|nr:hypothetical protein GPECTOR_14g183 [Gonium pectorale]|eukprot:KXZ50938.1 hypothetical protein GPECTOR_14g183 [Gonium pectorale]
MTTRCFAAPSNKTSPLDSNLGLDPDPKPEAESGPEPDWLQRTTLLLGPDGVAALAARRVVVVGLGGVGSYVAEFLVRAGVGNMAIVDGDVVDVTNKNRQLPALDSTVGQAKAQVMARRLLDINPRLNLVVRQEFMGPDAAAARLLDEVAAELDRGAAVAAAAGRQGSSSGTAATGQRGGGGGSGDGDGSGSPGTTPVAGHAAAHTPLDWVVDCIDSIAPKLALVAAAHRAGARVVSSMGAGGRLDPMAARVADISETYGDPFAANVRRGLRRTHGIREGITVVFSTEPCRRASLALTPKSHFKRSYYGTISYLPACFGLLIAAHILNVEAAGPMLASEAAQRRQLREAAPVQPKEKKKKKARGGGAGGAAAAAGTAAAKLTGGRGSGRRAGEADTGEVTDEGEQRLRRALEEPDVAGQPHTAASATNGGGGNGGGQGGLAGGGKGPGAGAAGTGEGLGGSAEAVAAVGRPAGGAEEALAAGAGGERGTVARTPRPPRPAATAAAQTLFDAVRHGSGLEGMGI